MDLYDGGKSGTCMKRISGGRFSRVIAGMRGDELLEISEKEGEQR